MTVNEQCDGRMTESQGLLFGPLQGGAMSQNETLDATDIADAEGVGWPRFRPPNRTRIGFRACRWHDLLPDGDPAQIVWEYVNSLDLGPLHRRIQAVEGRPG